MALVALMCVVCACVPVCVCVWCVCVFVRGGVMCVWCVGGGREVSSKAGQALLSHRRRHAVGPQLTQKAPCRSHARRSFYSVGSLSLAVFYSVGSLSLAVFYSVGSLSLAVRRA